MKRQVLGLALALAAAAQGAIELVHPVGGACVELVPPAQREVMNLPTLEARLARLADGGAEGKRLRRDKSWRKANPLVLKWKATEKERGPWEILIGKRADLVGARAVVLDPRTVKRDAEGVLSYELPWPNLELAATYHWRVTSDVRCTEYAHVRGCGCKHSQPEHASAVGCFRTDDLAPRWIALEGRVGNVRDLGGRLGLGGRRVRQGMVYRGQGLNENSNDGVRRGRNRLMVEDVDYLTRELGIRTDLDLRTARETAGMTESPLGAGVKLVLSPSSSYAGITNGNAKATMAKNFRLFCDRANYPIYFHCIAGADRTGALAYVLNGVLGVSRHELETDWESTFYPDVPFKDKKGEIVWNSEQHFNDVFGSYGDATTSWSDRVVLYLKSCGITDDEIAAFRSIMLEEDVRR